MIKTKHKNLSVIVIALLLVPVTVFALEKLTLTVSTKITVEERYSVYYLYNTYIKTSEIENSNNILECYPETAAVVNEDESIDEYTSCTFIDKDKKTYRAGESVNILYEPLPYLNIGECRYSEEEEKYICPFYSFYNTNILKFIYECGSEDNYISIDQFVKKVKSETYGFSEGTNFNSIQKYERKFYYNLCTEDEFNKMNFNPYSSKEWLGNSGYVWTNVRSQFNMPNHNVYILKEDNQKW